VVAAPDTGLVERDAELAAIAELVERTEGGSPGVLLLEGEGGVGKTQLLQHAVQLAAGGPLSVLAARGGELEQSFPFGIAAAGAPETIALLLASAERALARGSPGTAAACLRRALAEPPAAEQREAVLRRLGLVETRLGEPAAAEHVGEALRLTREPRDRAQLAFEASMGYLVGGRVDRAVAILEDGIGQVGQSDTELRWRLAAQLISLCRLETEHADLAARHLAAITRELSGATPGERLILAELAWSALIAAGPADWVAELALRSFGAGRLLVEQTGWSPRSSPRRAGSARPGRSA
jgi:hypothetical protein